MMNLKNRWRPIPLMELIGQLEKNQSLDRRAVVVTFDDGTDDNFTHAFPILARHKIPATIFMVVDNIDKPGQLAAQQMREMANGGISFGSHTLHHAYLPSLSLDQVRTELVESKTKLEQHNFQVNTMSYPAGGFSEKILREVRKAGYQGACTTNRGFRRFPIDRWALRRITMHANAATPCDLWLRCCGYYGLNRRLRNPG